MRCATEFTPAIPMGSHHPPDWRQYRMFARLSCGCMSSWWQAEDRPLRAVVGSTARCKHGLRPVVCVGTETVPSDWRTLRQKLERSAQQEAREQPSPVDPREQQAQPTRPEAKKAFEP